MSLKDINSRTWSSNHRKLVKWNDQQINILDEVKSSNQNMTIIARAGCGKTSILVGIVGALNNKANGNILAFNTHIADNLRTDKRIPSSRIKVSTAHSYGFSMFKRVIDGIDINKNKYNSILDNILSNEHIHIPDFIVGSQTYKQAITKDIMYGLHKLLSLCRSWLIDINDINSILELYDYYGYDFPIKQEYLEILCKCVSKTLIKGKNISTTQGIIDFGDMIWLPNELDLKIDTYKDIVLMDEAQDANLGMIGILNKLIGPSTRTVFMCDDKQEIYGFNGSVPGICNQISERFNTIIMPLTYCYRCPENHLEIVREWVPDIVCGKDDINGSVIRTTFHEMNKQYKPGMVVLSRFNTPLIELGIQLISQGIPVYMSNKDITQSYVSLLDSVKHMGMEEASLILQERKEKELNRVRKSQSKGTRKLKNITDRYDGVMFLIETFIETKPNIYSIITFLQDLQKKPQNESVNLNTIHSFKGGEADTIVVLDSDNMPYFGLCSTDWELNMEENIAYVAHTRSRKNMYLVNKKKEK